MCSLDANLALGVVRRRKQHSAPKQFGVVRRTNGKDTQKLEAVVDIDIDCGSSESICADLMLGASGIATGKASLTFLFQLRQPLTMCPCSQFSVLAFDLASSRWEF